MTTNAFSMNRGLFLDQNSRSMIDLTIAKTESDKQIVFDPNAHVRLIR
jgi:hypothetical protein